MKRVRLLRVGDMATSRVEALSDGIFAVILTLLVLEIHVPDLHGDNVGPELRHELAQMAPKFLVYAMSFAFICIWWVAHHHLFHVLTRCDRGLLWINALFMLWLSFIPFPTALMGDYPREPVAVMCYGAVTTLAGISFCAMRFYAFYVAKLVERSIERKLLRAAMIRSILNPVGHAIAVALAPFDTRIAIALYLAISLAFFVPSPLEREGVRVQDA